MRGHRALTWCSGEEEGMTSKGGVRLEIIRDGFMGEVALALHFQGSGVFSQTDKEATHIEVWRCEKSWYLMEQ